MCPVGGAQWLSGYHRGTSLLDEPEAPSHRQVQADLRTSSAGLTRKLHPPDRYYSPDWF